MATIGSLGDIVFSVSRSQIKTFDGMRWESSAQYASHNRHLKDELLEFVGSPADKISFSMTLSVYLERAGKILRLVIGNKAYGKNKWVITGLSKELERFDNKGNLLLAKVNVSLTAYAGR